MAKLRFADAMSCHVPFAPMVMRPPPLELRCLILQGHHSRSQFARAARVRPNPLDSRLTGETVVRSLEYPPANLLEESTLVMISKPYEVSTQRDGQRAIQCQTFGTWRWPLLKKCILSSDGRGHPVLNFGPQAAQLVRRAADGRAWGKLRDSHPL